MARYEIVIDDEDRDEQPFSPWNATLNGVLQSGKGREILASGFGSTPREAVEAVLEDILTYDDAPDWAPPLVIQ